MLLSKYMGESTDLTVCPKLRLFFSYFANAGHYSSPWGWVVKGDWEGSYRGSKIEKIPEPAGLVMNGDQGVRDIDGKPVDNWGLYIYTFDWYHNPVHGPRMNYLMADGHGAPYNMLDLAASLEARGLMRTGLWPEQTLRFPIENDGRDPIKL